jgi:hypothetical protein
VKEAHLPLWHFDDGRIVAVFTEIQMLAVFSDHIQLHAKSPEQISTTSG